MFANCFPKDRMLSRRRAGGLFLTLLLVAFGPQLALAHSPFESNARVTILEDQIEAAVTMGPGMARALLQGTGVDPTQARGAGAANLANPEIGERILSLAVADKNIPPQSVAVLGDGLEALLVVTFPRPAAGALKVSANYAKHVPAGTVSVLVVVDELGRMLGSHLVSSGNSVMEFQLAGNVSAVVVAVGSRPADTGQNLLTSATTDNEATAAAPQQSPSFLDYFKLGIHHIVTGYDHLLFLCGLLVGCKRVGPMLAIITCFTLAHSVTLGLAALELMAISPRLVEPIIAASIIFVGFENFRRGDNVTARCWLALGFGLIHGFGFAGALRETGLGLTAGSLVPALLSFNLGVELGQLVIAATFLGVLGQLRRFKPVEQYATSVTSSAVIALGGWWLVERTLLS